MPDIIFAAGKIIIMEITLGSEVILKTRLTMTWTVSYIEGNKIYCYRAGLDQQISSIVADVSMLIPCEPVKKKA